MGVFDDLKKAAKKAVRQAGEAYDKTKEVIEDVTDKTVKTVENVTEKANKFSEDLENDRRGTLKNVTSSLLEKSAELGKGALEVSKNALKKGEEMLHDYVADEDDEDSKTEEEE